MAPDDLRAAALNLGVIDSVLVLWKPEGAKMGRLGMESNIDGSKMPPRDGC